MTVVVLNKRERQVGGDHGYVRSTDEVTIAIVHRSSLAAASQQPYPRLIKHAGVHHTTYGRTLPHTFYY